jgi:hypothetical protein
MNSVSIRGVLTRKPFCSDKFAAFSVKPDAGSDGRAPILDVVAFDADPIAAIRRMGEGDAVLVEGKLGSKRMTAKDRSTVQVDGRDLWVMQLVAESVRSAVLPAQTEKQIDAKSAPVGDDDIPF